MHLSAGEVSLLCMDVQEGAFLMADGYDEALVRFTREITVWAPRRSAPHTFPVGATCRMIKRFDEGNWWSSWDPDAALVVPDDAVDVVTRYSSAHDHHDRERERLLDDDWTAGE